MSNSIMSGNEEMGRQIKVRPYIHILHLNLKIYSRDPGQPIFSIRTTRVLRIGPEIGLHGYTTACLERLEVSSLNRALPSRIIYLEITLCSS